MWHRYTQLSLWYDRTALQTVTTTTGSHQDSFDLVICLAEPAFIFISPVAYKNIQENLLNVYPKVDKARLKYSDQ